MRVATLWLLLGSVSLACCSGPLAPVGSWLEGHPDSEQAHAHLSLVPHPRPTLLDRKEFDAYLEEVKDDHFLDSQGVSSENPVAPCALLAAGVIGKELNRIWFAITVEREVPIPPSGTWILGMFDEDIRGGQVPRDDAARAAEIIARLFVWYSWALDAPANTLIHEMTQRQCLGLLLSSVDRVVAEEREAFSNPLYSHSAAVRNYSATFPGEELEQFLGELRAEGFLDRPSTYPSNPVVPCSLLRAFRLAGRLNELWGRILGAAPAARQRPEKQQFYDELRREALPGGDLRRAAEVTARLFGDLIWQFDEVTDDLLSDVTQRECLDEIFQPGLIRERKSRS